MNKEAAWHCWKAGFIEALNFYLKETKQVSFEDLNSEMKRRMEEEFDLWWHPLL